MVQATALPPIDHIRLNLDGEALVVASTTLTDIQAEQYLGVINQVLDDQAMVRQVPDSPKWPTRFRVWLPVNRRQDGQGTRLYNKLVAGLSPKIPTSAVAYLCKLPLARQFETERPVPATGVGIGFLAQQDTLTMTTIIERFTKRCGSLGIRATLLHREPTFFTMRCSGKNATFATDDLLKEDSALWQFGSTVGIRLAFVVDARKLADADTAPKEFVRQIQGHLPTI